MHKKTAGGVSFLAEYEKNTGKRVRLAIADCS